MHNPAAQPPPTRNTLSPATYVSLPPSNPVGACHWFALPSLATTPTSRLVGACLGSPSRPSPPHQRRVL